MMFFWKLAHAMQTQQLYRYPIYRSTMALYRSMDGWNLGHKFSNLKPKVRSKRIPDIQCEYSAYAAVIK